MKQQLTCGADVALQEEGMFCKLLRLEEGRSCGDEPYASSRTCQRHTCCPRLSFMTCQWSCSSLPLLFCPSAIQPTISLRFMLRRVLMETSSVTSDSWNSATWKTNVSL